MYLSSKTTQRSDWSASEPVISQPQQIFNETSSKHALSNQISPTNISQNQLETSKKIKQTFQCRPLQCWSSPPPCIQGVLLGVLAGCFLLTIVLPLWLITTTTTKTTTERPMVALNQANDRIIGLYNTTAGGSTGGFNGRYSSANEMPPYAMDNSTTTKYLNFGHLGGLGFVVQNPGIGTGFIVTPSISNTTVACGLLFATGNDYPNRDPLTTTFEGSNASTIAALNLGSSWTLIYNGSTGISSTLDPGRSTYVTQQNFSNTNPYASYRLLITSQRGNSGSTQYSEARIIGYI